MYNKKREEVDEFKYLRCCKTKYSRPKPKIRCRKENAWKFLANPTLLLKIQYRFFAIAFNHGLWEDIRHDWNPLKCIDA